MKKITLSVAAVAAVLFTTSCSQKISSASKNAVNFPGMTVSRTDYKLSKDVTADVEVKEFVACTVGNEGAFVMKWILGTDKTIDCQKAVIGQHPLPPHCSHPIAREPPTADPHGGWCGG